METKEIIEGLRDLIKDRESFIQKDEEDCIFKHDVEVLKGAIEIIEKTAQEVPVQEQFPLNINALRIKNGLEPIPNGDTDFIPTK